MTQTEAFKYLPDLLGVFVLAGDVRKVMRLHSADPLLFRSWTAGSLDVHSSNNPWLIRQINRSMVFTTYKSNRWCLDSHVRKNGWFCFSVRFNFSFSRSTSVICFVQSWEANSLSAGQHSVPLPDLPSVNTYHPSVISWQRKQAGMAESLGRIGL